MDTGFLDGLLKGFKDKQPEALLDRCKYQERLITGLLKLMVTRKLISVADAQTVIKDARI